MPSREEKDRTLITYPQENLESPFLDEELFVNENDAEAEPHLEALQSETSFRYAFEEKAPSDRFKSDILETGEPDTEERYIALDAEATKASEKTVWIQTILNKAENERLNLDGIYGPNTRRAVSRFQKRYGLAVDGKVGPETETALIQLALEQISNQSLFSKKGLKDQRTIQEIKRFQQRHNLEPNGENDAATRAAILASLGGVSFPEPVTSSVDEPTKNRTGAALDGPPINRGDRVRLWTRNGEPVIYEYKDGKRIGKLTYENEKGRSYYRVGDVILLKTLGARRTEKAFPELRAAQEGEPSAIESGLWLTVALLGWEEPEYTHGWKIINIFHTGGGQGSVKLQAVIFFDKETPALLHKTQTPQRLELNKKFIESPLGDELAARLIPLANLAREISEIGVGGIRKIISRQLAKAGKRQAIRLGLRRVFQRIVAVLNTILIRCTIDFFTGFTKAFAKELMTLSQEQKMRARAKMREVSKDWPLFEPTKKATAAGIKDVVRCLVKKTLEDPLVKGIEKSMLKILPVAERTLKFRMEEFIAKELAKLFTGVLPMIAGAVSKSVANAWDDKGFDTDKFTLGLVDQLKVEIESLLRDKPRGWTEGLADEFMKVL